MTSNELSNSLTFPIKLKKIVDAPETDNLIYWDEGGTSFHISDENQFARDIIPNYFKHSNISSFIRQLNMYGFHKVNRIDNGLAIIGTGNDDSQWVHPNFQRDKPELLSAIVRKPVSTNSSNELVPYDSVKGDIARLAKMVQYLKKRDEETSEQLKSLQDENHELYTELMFLRKQHEQQTKCIDMLIDFFSRCTKKPQSLPSRFKTKRNILALECPQTNVNVSGSPSEPPRKCFITRPVNNNSSTSITNDMYKGKKVIKISNLPPSSHIDINGPKTISSLPNTGIYQLPSSVANNQSQKTPVIYTLSMPKNVTNNNQSRIPVRAITASNTYPSIAVQKPIIKAASNQPSVMFPKSNPSTKTVTVSTVNSKPELLNDAQHQYHYDINDARGNNAMNYNNQSPQTISSRQNHPSYETSNNQNIISGISSGVDDVEQCLDYINNMFDTEPSPDQSNIGDVYQRTSRSDLMSEKCVDNDMDVDVDDEDWKMLLDNIRADALMKDMDPGKIHGHELIPFIGGHLDQTEPPHCDSYSIDDLLQTPEMSNMSLDFMNDNRYQGP